LKILSAHRHPDAVARFAEKAREEGVRVIVAGAGGAAHLAGAIAARTVIPVIGVPLVSGPLGGVDAFFSTLQMPAGVPVATMSVGRPGAVNAAILAARILAAQDAPAPGTVSAPTGPAAPATPRTRRK
nr:5-(carboxyamino)imidazole ribonucleotide mutase [bacterium]